MKVLTTVVHASICMFALLLVMMGNDLLLLANPKHITDTWFGEKYDISYIDNSNYLEEFILYSNYKTSISKLMPEEDASDRIKTTNLDSKLTYTQEEWFPFLGFKYDLDSLHWSERDKVLFTNILFRESGSTVISRNHEIDQYFVAIAAIRRYVDKKTGIVPIVKYSKSFARFKNQAIKTTEDSYYVPRFVGAFSMTSYEKPSFKRNIKANEAAWEQCYKVVTNVLNGTIPDFVPYIPHGTFAYLKKSIDTDYNWINAVTKKWVVVATTIKDHHYYADPDCMTKEEKEHLMSNPFNPIRDFNEGLFADMIRDANNSVTKIRADSLNKAGYSLSVQKKSS